MIILNISSLETTKCARSPPTLPYNRFESVGAAKFKKQNKRDTPTDGVALEVLMNSPCSGKRP